MFGKNEPKKVILLPCEVEIVAEPLTIAEQEELDELIRQRTELEKKGRILWKSSAAQIAALTYKKEQYGTEGE